MKIGNKDNFTTERLCAGMENVKSDLIVNNFYSSSNNRTSFAIEIRKCTKDDNITCKPDSEINQML